MTGRELYELYTMSCDKYDVLYFTWNMLSIDSQLVWEDLARQIKK